MKKSLFYLAMVSLILLSLNGCIAFLAGKAVGLAVDVATSSIPATHKIEVVKKDKVLSKSEPWAVAFTGLGDGTNVAWQRDVLPKVISEVGLENCDIIDTVATTEINPIGRNVLIFRVKSLDMKKDHRGVRTYNTSCYLDIYESNNHSQVGRIWGSSSDNTNIPGFNQEEQFTDLAVKMLNEHYF